MPIYRIDWRREFARLEPYFSGQGGVIHVHFRGADCAPNNFNAVLKRSFHDDRPVAERLSLRIDEAWHTTHTVDDILDAFEEKLRAAGFGMAASIAPDAGGQLLSNLSVAGDLNISISDSSLSAGAGRTTARRKQRLAAICQNLREYLRSGGRMLIELNDQPAAFQKQFWGLWRSGLSALVESGLVLVYMIGPRAGGHAHADAPGPDEEINLPQSYETEDERQDHVYDDLIDIFRDNGLSPDEASTAATVHLRTTKSSVGKLHDELSGVLMDLSRKRGRR